MRKFDPQKIQKARFLNGQRNAAVHEATRLF